MKPVEFFDAHMHIIDPRFPLVKNNDYVPDAFTCNDYLDRLQKFALRGGAVVSGSFQGFDQSYMRDALSRLGPAFVGVINLAATASDQEIVDLNSIGVRAVRFNLKRGGSESVMQIRELASRIYDLCSWHVELYVDAGEIDELYQTLVRLPVLCIDHLGLNNSGFHSLLNLVEKGSYVKASGFGRLNFDAKEAMKKIYSINPAALLFGTDLPSTRAPRPFHDDDIRLINESFDPNEAGNIFYNNAIALYKPKRIDLT